MKNNKEYVNVACSLYDEYVILAMRKEKLVISDSSEEVIIADIFTKNKEEFISCSNGRILRLDQFKIIGNCIEILKD